MKIKKLLIMMICLSMFALTISSCSVTTSTTASVAPTTAAAATTAGTTKAGEATVAGTTAASGKNPIKIAAIFAKSGGMAESGEMCLDGAALAVKHINEKGGIKSLGGRPIELVIFDETSDPAQVKNVGERALSDSSIVAAIGGSNSALTIPMLPAFEKAKVPIVTFNNAKDVTNQGYNYVFSITNRGTEIGNYTVKYLDYMNKNMDAKLKKVAIIYENSANGINMADGARANLKSLGLEIVFDQSYPAGTVDFAPMITTIKNSNADVVLPFGYMQEGKLIMTTMRDLKYYPLVMSNTVWPSFYKALGDASNGVIASGNWNWDTKTIQDNPEYTKIVKEFEATYGYYMTEHSGPAYESLRIIANAIEKSGSLDPKVIRDTISSTELPGMQLGGPYKFNEKGENVNGIPAVSQWQYGKPVCIFPAEYAGAKYIAPADFK